MLSSRRIINICVLILGRILLFRILKNIVLIELWLLPVHQECMGREGLKAHEIADADVRRVGDSRVQAIAESDPFTDLVRRLKSR